jgi:Secretion system C-terminal sorting domain
MKKIILASLMLATSVQLNAQIAFEKMQVLKKTMNNYSAVNKQNKLSRSVGNRLDKTNRYLDTSQNYPQLGKAFLQNEDYYFYKNGKASVQETNDFYVPTATADGFFRSRTIEAITSGNSDSTSTFVEYDNAERAVNVTEAYYNGLNYDTSNITDFKYIGTNTIPDSVFVYDYNTGAKKLNTIYKYFVSNGNEDSSFAYQDDGTGNFVNVIADYYKYNNLALITETINSFNFGGIAFKSKINRYYTGSKLDSTENYSFTNGQFVKNQINKYIYGIGKTKISTFEDDGTQTGNFLNNQSQIVTLNALGKAISKENFIIVPLDSLLRSKSTYVYNNNNDLIKSYSQNADFTTSVLSPLAFDSTNYYYSPFFPAANNNVTIINNISVYPNPVANYAFIQYASDANVPYTLVVTNAIGKVIHTQQGNALHGNSYITIDAQNWHSGLYFATIIANNQVSKTLKISKK